MRLKRHQKAERNINFYCVNFGFRKPFQILVDGTFCMASAQVRITVPIQNYFYINVDIFTTIRTECKYGKIYPSIWVVM